MSLDYAEFAHFYDGSSLTEDQRREDFDVHVCFLQCLVRYFWRREPVPNGLGISFDKDALEQLDRLDSGAAITTIFNNSVREDARIRNAP